MISEGSCDIEETSQWMAAFI